MAEDKTQLIALKDLFVLIPVVGTTIAALYEVGFFYGVGISYFTLFSLSEHIVFALTALPYAVGLALMLPTAYISFKLGGIDADKRTPPIPTAPASVEELTKVRDAIAVYQKRNLNRLLWFSVATLAIACATAYFGMITLTAIMVCLSLSGLAHARYPEIVTADKSMTVGFILGGLIVSFCAGLDNAKWVLRSKTATEVLKLAEGELQGQIIRSGDKGVLFFDVALQKITFVIWSDVKRISAK